MTNDLKRMTDRVNKISKSKPMEPKKQVKPEERFVSTLEDNGILIEMGYDPSTDHTYFIVWDGESVTKVESYEKNGTIYKPFPASKDIIRNGTVLFPSDATDYGESADIVHDVHTFIHKYLTVSDAYEQIAVHYVLFTWIFDRFEELPYLRALGDYGSGKSRFLKTIGSLCNKPIFTSGAGTVSPVFRLLQDYRGTLVIDEADMRDSDTYNELVKILNSGFQTGVPVPRTHGSNEKDFDVKSFDVFGCKIIAARFHFDDEALESRLLTEDMSVIKMRDDVPTGSTQDFKADALMLRNKLLMYRFRNFHSTAYNEELVIPGIEPRLNQIAVPLMSTISDENTLQILRDYFQKCDGRIQNDREHTLIYRLTDSLCALIKDGTAEPTVKQIADHFNAGSYGSDYRETRKVGFYLHKYLGLRSRRTRNGYVISEENREKVIALAEKYKLNDVKFVNVMNVNVDKEEEK